MGLTTNKQTIEPISDTSFDQFRASRTSSDNSVSSIDGTDKQYENDIDSFFNCFDADGDSVCLESSDDHEWACPDSFLDDASGLLLDEKDSSTSSCVSQSTLHASNYSHYDVSLDLSKYTPSADPFPDPLSLIEPVSFLDEKDSSTTGSSDSQSTSHASNYDDPQNDNSSSSSSLKPTAVYFGSIKDAGTSRWRAVVSEFSSNRETYPTWKDEIANRVLQRLDEEGLNRFYNRQNPKSRSSSDRASWCLATRHEIVVKTRQRFLDDRKARKQSSAPSWKQHGQSTTATTKILLESSSLCGVAQDGMFSVVNRQQFPLIQPGIVCFGWDNHPGTFLWQQIVKSFAKDDVEFPKWDDTIVSLTKRELAKKNIQNFLVFLDSQGNQTLTLTDGLWFKATPEDIHEITKQHFLHFRTESIPANCEKTNAGKVDDSIDETSSICALLHIDDSKNMTPSLVQGCLPGKISVCQSSLIQPSNEIPSQSVSSKPNNVSGKRATIGKYDENPDDNSSCDATLSSNDQSRASSSDQESTESPQKPEMATRVKAVKSESLENDGSKMETSTEKPSGDFNDDLVMPTENDVCFGWITHAGTKIWRNVVKRYSDNRSDFPNWSDQICNLVTNILDRMGIARYLVFRDPDGNPVRKIFNANKECQGTWYVASVEEILDKTRQRFLNDRKTVQEMSAGVKRPRGRPRKGGDPPFPETCSTAHKRQCESSTRDSGGGNAFMSETN